MHELTRISLDNEMDLILAHKRSMKLSEMCGLSLSAQTTFATAVSEVSRMSIDTGKKSFLSLSLDLQKRDNYIVASLNLQQEFGKKEGHGLEYAKRLVAKHNVSVKGDETLIELFYYFQSSQKIDFRKIDEWRTIFRNEPPVSPYEELKRKNEQLQELSEKIQKSEAAYKTLTNSLPLFIFTMDSDANLLFANEWLTNYTGETIETLNKSKWKDIVFPDDYPGFALMMEKSVTQGAAAINIQLRLLKSSEKKFFWHQITFSPFQNEKGELLHWIGFIADIHSQKIYEETLKDNAELKEAEIRLKENQEKLEEYIEELNRSNLELQQFAFVASHDLQEPVRKLLYYSDSLLEKYKNDLDERGGVFLSGINSSAKRMRVLIQDLLVFSQINKNVINYLDVDLNRTIEESEQELELLIKEKNATIKRQNLPTIKGDPQMFRQLFGNLLSNSLKYARKDQAPVIDISFSQVSNHVEIFVKDNGIGFDEKYLPKMFGLFQRLHSREEFAGTGMGLAICKKIVDIHNGKISASSNMQQGATFTVELPIKPQTIDVRS